ncbi:hypothetical protein OXX80_007214 [Metschnikowia pulcherrima]
MNSCNTQKHATNHNEESLPPYKDESPEYTSSLQFYGLALHKVEFDTPWSDRSSSLKPVVVELNSNQLNLYEFCADKTVINAVKQLFKHQNYDDGSSHEQAADNSDDYLFDGDAYGDASPNPHKPMFSKLRNRIDKKKSQKFLHALPPDVCNNNLLFEPVSDPQNYTTFAATYRGKLLHSYTLSNLSVGEAPSSMSANYKEDKSHNKFALVKYRNALRLRVEYTQMLLHFWSFHGMVHWYRNLCVGRDLAASIDERKVSQIKSIPRNFSLANNALLEASAREALTFNPETRKMAHRDSFSSVEDCSSCFSECSLGSTGTRASSIETCPDFCKKAAVDIFGSKIACLENMYTPIEKQYISNCIPVLNSFDKWIGAKVTISNYESFMPKNDKSNVNEENRVFISQYTFNTSVRNYNKHAPSAGVRKCKDFYVDSAGLVSLDTTVKT